MKLEDRFQAIAVVLALVAVVVLAIFAAPWWEQDLRPGPASRPGALLGVGRPQAGPPPPLDQAIEDRLSSLLSSELGVRAPQLEVAVQEGRVTLLGPTPSLAVSRRAAALAAGTYGVREVADSTIPRLSPAGVGNAREALADEPGLAGTVLQVERGPKGVVLSGRVSSLAQRHLAEAVVAEVAGVGRLVVRIDVAARGDRTDSQIREEVDRRLRGDGLLDSSGLVVEVRDRSVHLSGSVPTAAEKLWALRDASVEGAREVQADQVEVRPAQRSLEGRRPARSDVELRHDLLETFRWDPRLGDAVAADVVDGVATLRGTLRTLAARRAAVEAARQRSGVLLVVDRLRVAGAGQQLEQRASDALDRSAWMRVPIRLRESDGVVRLDGVVADAWHRDRAQAAVEGISGVLAVDNDLAVQDPRPLPDDPFLGDPAPLETDSWSEPVPATLRRDEDLLRSVRELLRWNAFVADSGLEVRVDRGVVHLSGTVRGPCELRSARATALRAGAVAVDDDLTLEPR